MSCGGAIITIMIDRTIAITPSAMSLGGIASSKRSVDNSAHSTRHGILVFLASASAGPRPLAVGLLPLVSHLAEKARGTYRTTASHFEEFAYDAQMPESMRALAEKSMAQTRELYVHSLETVLESWERFVVAAGQGTLALNRKAIDITRRNINDGFGLVERLAGAKNLAEAMELQTTYWRKQVGELASRAGELRTLSARVTAERRSRRG